MKRPYGAVPISPQSQRVSEYEKDWIDDLIRRGKLQFPKFLDPKFWCNKDIVLKLLKVRRDSHDYVNDSLLGDGEIVFALVRAGGLISQGP
jgi:hypothetical protein